MSKPPDMFERERVIEFGELKTLNLDAGIIDHAWLKHEEKPKEEEEDVQKGQRQLTLFEFNVCK
ncbi:MAG: hypothetical protein WBX00_02700 [Isosphaeraceae bacterium]